MFLAGILFEHVCCGYTEQAAWSYTQLKINFWKQTIWNNQSRAKIHRIIDEPSILTSRSIRHRRSKSKLMQAVASSNLKHQYLSSIAISWAGQPRNQYHCPRLMKAAYVVEEHCLSEGENNHRFVDEVHVQVVNQCTHEDDDSMNTLPLWWSGNSWFTDAMNGVSSSILPGMMMSDTKISLMSATGGV